MAIQPTESGSSAGLTNQLSDSQAQLRQLIPTITPYEATTSGDTENS